MADGVVTSADVVGINNVIGSGVYNIFADLNGDGKVDATDVTHRSQPKRQAPVIALTEPAPARSARAAIQADPADSLEYPTSAQEAHDETLDFCHFPDRACDPRRLSLLMLAAQTARADLVFAVENTFVTGGTSTGNAIDVTLTNTGASCRRHRRLCIPGDCLE